LTTGHTTTTHGRFNVVGHTGATWRIRLNLCFLRPTRAHNPNGKRIGSAVLAQFTAESPYNYNGLCFPPKLTLPTGDLDSHLTHDSLGPAEPTTQTASRSVQPFCTDDCRVSLYFTMGRPFPPQNCPFPWGSEPTYMVPGPISALNPNGISITSAVFAELTSVTDRPTNRPKDHTTQSVTIDRPHLRRSTSDVA